MEITEVRVKLVRDTSDQLKAFCSITLDGLFVIRDLKVIERRTGFFVAMPSRKVSDRCPKCRYKNHIRARFCNECGGELPTSREGRVKLYVDVAHPINSECRQMVQQRVIEAFEEEFERSKEPGYVGQDYDDTDGEVQSPAAAESREPRESRDDQMPAGPAPSMESSDDDRDDEMSDKRDDETSDKGGGSEYDELIRSLKNDAQQRRSRHDGSAKPAHRSPSPTKSRLDQPAFADSLADEDPADSEPATDKRSTPEPKPTTRPAPVAAAPVAPKPEPAPREPARPEPASRPATPPAPTGFGDGLGFGEGLDMDDPSPAPPVKAPPADPPAVKPPAEAVPSHAEVTEETGGFGAGIL